MRSSTSGRSSQENGRPSASSPEPPTSRPRLCVSRCSFVTRGPLGKLLILEGPRDANKDRELFFILDGQARVEVRGSRVATLK